VGPAVAILLLVACSGASTSPDSLASPTTGSTFSSGPTTTASGPLGEIGEVEVVAQGAQFLELEGPQWVHKDGVLLFSDASADTIYQLGADDTITVFRTPSNYSNGLAVDPKGRLIVAESAARRVTLIENDGTATTLAERFEGNRLNQPNDLVVRSDGTVYFTDPAFGDAVAKAELEFRGVFRISPHGDLTAERRGDVTEEPNGVALSPDESMLYVADYAADEIWVFEVAPDGSLSDARTFVTTGSGPDGVAVDDAGNVFVATIEGVEVFTPEGGSAGVIQVPLTPSNCAFGGADGRTLFITARDGLFRVRLPNPGPY
jgi:gluconolactonase